MVIFLPIYQNLTPCHRLKASKLLSYVQKGFEIYLVPAVGGFHF